MSITNDVSQNSVLAELSAGSSSSTETKKNELGKHDFLKLMIAQLENQDPLNPTEGAEFVAQLAQFSSVEGIEQLNSSVGDMATSFRSGQALQASSLVGRAVEIPGNSSLLTAGGNIQGVIELPQSTDHLVVGISNANGEQVNRINLGSQSSGDIAYLWDGRDSDGNIVPEGKYTINAEARISGDATSVPTTVSAQVNSVTLGNYGDITLNVNGVGQVNLNEVKTVF